MLYEEKKEQQEKKEAREMKKFWIHLINKKRKLYIFIIYFLNCREINDFFSIFPNVCIKKIRALEPS